MTRVAIALVLLAGGAWAPVSQEGALPNRAASLKFAAIGDNGTGEPAEYDVAREMARRHAGFPFESSWAEHLRQHDRAIRGDSTVEQFLATQIGSEPTVRHFIHAG